MKTTLIGAAIAALMIACANAPAMAHEAQADGQYFSYSDRFVNNDLTPGAAAQALREDTYANGRATEDFSAGDSFSVVNDDIFMRTAYGYGLIDDVGAATEDTSLAGIYGAIDIYGYLGDADISFG